jgi:hypothetical protein
MSFVALIIAAVQSIMTLFDGINNVVSLPCEQQFLQELLK